MVRQTVRINDKIIIADGKSPLSYLNLPNNTLYTAPQAHYAKNVYVDLDGTIKPRKNPTDGLYKFDGQFFFDLRGTIK